MIGGDCQALAGKTRPARAGRRREIRLPVRVPGAIVAAGEPPLRVQLADLSRGGARCFALEPPRVGSVVELRLDGLGIAATVCWTSGSMCGLCFNRQIRAIDLLIQSAKTSAPPVDAPDGSRLFLRGR